jgi:radical SAM family uncharacterized protein
LGSVPEYLLDQVEKPVRYIGQEINMTVKDPDCVCIRYAFAFPDVYEIGMSHLGLRILYQLINVRPDAYCERVFAPWSDMEALMRAHEVPLCTLETGTPLSDFDFIGFTLQYELSYTNVLNMLDLGEIPLYSSQRDDTHPFVMAGGPCTANPEPLADFVDLFVIGEGEETLPEVLDLYRDWKQRGAARMDFLRDVSRIEGVYVPAFYTVAYHEDGTLAAITPRGDAPARIRKRIVTDLSTAFYPEEMLVPYMDIVHNRVVLEVMRGCIRGCRFCQAGFIYRPARERELTRLCDLAAHLIDATGYEEMSLSSLSTSDYRELAQLVSRLESEQGARGVSLALPSLRVDSFSQDYLSTHPRARKTGLTFAPEAGTQRLRDVINKNITEDDIFAGARAAFAAGWTRVKLYFMLGLPTEALEDVDAIAGLVRCIRQCYQEMADKKDRKKLNIAVATSSFVPKPFTPFQWVGQATVDSLRDKQQRLKELLRIPGVAYRWHDVHTSRLEAVFARGDRRLGQVLRLAWQCGCKLDGWAEHFHYDRWMQAFADAGLDPDFYAARERTETEVLPWAHIDMGVDTAFLWREYRRALAGKTTPDCRSACAGCGVKDTWEGACP